MRIFHDDICSMLRDWLFELDFHGYRLQLYRFASNWVCAKFHRDCEIILAWGVGGLLEMQAEPIWKQIDRASRNRIKIFIIIQKQGKDIVTFS